MTHSVYEIVAIRFNSYVYSWGAKTYFYLLHILEGYTEFVRHWFAVTVKVIIKYFRFIDFNRCGE
jgi:hypothetical protein